MTDAQDLSIPFLTADMLRFKGAVSFELQITSQATDTGTLTIRGMTRDGVFTFRHTVVNTGAPTVENYAIPDIPTLITVQDIDGNFQQGQCFATLNLVANGDVIFQLISGNIWIGNGQSYPNAQLKENRPGGGELKVLTSTDPAAGTEPSIIIGTYETWRLQSVNFTLVTDANVANRRVHLVLRASGGDEMNFFSSYDHPASTTRKYTCAPVGAGLDDQDDNDVIIPIPANLWFSSSSYIKTETTNKQVGDNWGVMQANVEAYFER